MSEKEKWILETLAQNMGRMSDRKLDYMEGFVAGLTTNVQREEQKEAKDGKGA